jgi:1-deoxy-D-xylulose-5-phosphate reductoisomerase
MSRRVVILGATGSIGRSTLDIVERSPDRFSVSAVTAATNVDALAAIARRTSARRAVIADESRLEDLRERLAGTGIEAAAGDTAMIETAAMDADIVMAAIVGCAGLGPVMAAVEAGRTVALANKEALVTAGSLMTRAAQASGSTILPVDSEHNAIFQCLAGGRSEDVERLILTASGGPFRTVPLDEMRVATPQRAVAHPNWSMGAKISIDSATMMNKGLELVEAHHLFGLPGDRIDIVVHPQSVVHSMVEYRDGSVIAQLGSPDMRIPIAYALAWPERIATPVERLDLIKAARLDFEAPDTTRFPALRLAREALDAGGAAPIVLNAANEVGVAHFLAGRIGFLEIAELVERALGECGSSAPQSIDEVLDIDRRTREWADTAIQAVCK